MLTTKITVPFLEHDAELAYRWPESKAQDWFDKYGWSVGCNYVPGNAINQIEMWQAESFSPDLIDKELSWASILNCCCSVHEFQKVQLLLSFQLKLLSTFLSLLACQLWVKPQ